MNLQYVALLGSGIDLARLDLIYIGVCDRLMLGRGGFPRHLEERIVEAYASEENLQVRHGLDFFGLLFHALLA